MNNDKMATFKADAVNKDGKWHAVVYEQWEGYAVPHEHHGITPHEDRDKALDESFNLARNLVEHYQSVVNRELSKMHDWLNLSLEERVKRAKEIFPIGSPFRKHSDDPQP
jgi:hypothetical protein